MDTTPVICGFGKSSLEQILSGMLITGEHICDADERARTGGGELSELLPRTFIHIGLLPSHPLRRSTATSPMPHQQEDHLHGTLRPRER
jgi:hypothetical protein